MRWPTSSKRTRAWPGCSMPTTPTAWMKGTREETVRFMDRLKLISIVTHVADAKSCILHPASHTHRQLSDEQLRAAGIAPDLMRLSLGIESAEDLVADLRQALDESAQ